MVPAVYKQVKEFMNCCLKFSDELKMPQAEIDSMVRRASNLLLTRSFSGCLSALFKNPSLALMQVIQILIDTQYLESASQHLDEYVCELTGAPRALQVNCKILFNRFEIQMIITSRPLKQCSELLAMMQKNKFVTN